MIGITATQFIHEANKQVLEDYFKLSQCSDISTQMYVVRTVISHFTPQYDVEADTLFIQYFPRELYDELERIGENGPHVDEYLEKKTLFFNIFDFIFRNLNMINEIKAVRYILLLLKFLKPIHHRDGGFDPTRLFQSIENCFINELNTIFFINENSAFDFFNYFKDHLEGLEQRFWNLCRSIYSGSSHIRSYLCIPKLSQSVSTIMAKFYCKDDDDYGRILVTVFMMLRRLSLIDEIEFNVNKLYEITFSIFKRHFIARNHSLFMPLFSKIWSEILNGKVNKFNIDMIDKLIFLTGIFSIRLSDKLFNFVLASTSERLKKPKPFRVTEKTKQRLYIIHLVLISFPFIDQIKYDWLYQAIIDLHGHFQNLFGLEITENLPFESTFHLYHYYTKSFAVTRTSYTTFDERRLGHNVEIIFSESSLSNVY
ncbi:hypothetical protein RF11_11628 [Thelohanellus kitauei]|uniref:Uncharacterized protein n=1 Tax=Thelohanellus kitauei TaxID=669202 RepID=A0A0C2ICT4_THEKT|nr:hypothetical protein RF11_11628 [Thelohanellus kitauei]